MGDYRLTPDGVQARQLNKKELELLRETEARLSQVRAPKLLDSSRYRVYVAAMDGTGNHLHKDAPENITVVGRLKTQLESLGHPAIGVGYVPGIGTQDRFLPRAIDGMAATTFEVRVEQAYLELCRQTFWWLKEDPDARIHVAGIGFSRGAEAVAALQRMVHERGIRDPSASQTRYGPDGILQRITWADHPPLVPPGRTAQVALLIDPVATGLHDHDRRLPGSNVGALQFTSVIEPRDHFQGTLLVPLGLSDGGRVANLLIPGSHSDTGGSYTLDGAGRVVHNASVDYFNAVFGVKLLQQAPVALDPRMYVAHRSDQHLMGAWPSARWQREGERGMHAALGPSCELAAGKPCLREPIDYRLADGLHYSYVVRGRPPGGTDAKMDLAQVSIERMYERFPTRLERAMAANPGPGSAQVIQVRDRIKELYGQLVDGATEGSEHLLKMAVRGYQATPMGQLMQPGFAAAQAWMAEQQTRGQPPDPFQAQQAAPPMQP